MQKLNKIQQSKLKYLLDSKITEDYDKTLLRAINLKNVSIAENKLLIELFNKYF